MNKKGFTIIEIIIVATFASLLFILFFVQKSNLDAMARDEKRAGEINREMCAGAHGGDGDDIELLGE